MHYFKKKIVFVLLIILCSCAQPKYSEQSQQKPLRNEQNSISCDTKFASGHCVSIEWEQMPNEENFVSFFFKIFRENKLDKSPILEDIDTSVMLFMPSMGHGSSPISVEKIDTGTYKASNVFFSMKGLWEIRFRKNSHEKPDEAIYQYTL